MSFSDWALLAVLQLEVVTCFLIVTLARDQGDW